jgi:hypothetical protein
LRWRDLGRREVDGRTCSPPVGGCASARLADSPQTTGRDQWQAVGGAQSARSDPADPSDRPDRRSTARRDGAVNCVPGAVFQLVVPVRPPRPTSAFWTTGRAGTNRPVHMAGNPQVNRGFSARPRRNVRAASAAGDARCGQTVVGDAGGLPRRYGRRPGDVRAKRVVTSLSSRRRMLRARSTLGVR